MKCCGRDIESLYYRQSRQMSTIQRLRSTQHPPTPPRLYQIYSRGCSVLRHSSMEENEREREEERSSSSSSSRATNEVWSWGAGTDGQLGTSTLEDSHLPQLLSPLSFQQSITRLACGGAHVIALTGQDGRVLSWGRGTSGQLGHGDLQNCLYPKHVKSLESLVITHVSAGWNHSGFVSERGRVFTCGDGSFGQLGHGDYKAQSLPTEIQSLGSKHVNQIACGMRHSLVLLKAKGPLSNPIFGFGSAKRGQLGIPKGRIMKNSNLPQVACGFEDVEVVSIIANGDHSAALTADGCLYTWGRGFCGSSDVHVPLLFSSPLRFTRVALGWNHALVLTDEGEVFMLGGNHHGLLSDPQTVGEVQNSHRTSFQGSDGDCGILVLRKVPGLNGIKVVDIAAGSEHSALVTVDGKIKTWGWGEHGQLGLGDVCDHTSPQIVTLGDRNDHSQLRVYCGSGFTFIVGKS